MVDDINSQGQSSPAYLTAMAGKLYFIAYNDNDGNELADDPSKDVNSGENPIMVADIWPGSTAYNGNIYPNSSSPYDLTELGGKLYFSAYNETNGYELWVYDPEDIVSTDATTDNPPRIAANIWPGSDGSEPAYLTAMGGKLYFRANNGVNGWNFGFLTRKVTLDIF